MNGDTKRAAGAAGFLALYGVIQEGPAGLAFLLEPVPAPMWYHIMAVAVPTGELLAAARAFVYNRTGAERSERASED